MRANLTLGGLALGLSLWSGPVDGQTRFMWPDTTVDVATYTTVPQCQAAVGRVWGVVAGREMRIGGFWPDTLQFDPAEAGKPVPTLVAETAARCLTRFDAVGAVLLTDFGPLLAGYLLAGWEAKARALADRRLAAVAAQDERELAAVLDSIVSIYLGRVGRAYDVPWNVQAPPRITVADEIVAAHATRVPDRVARLGLYSKLLSVAASPRVRDSARAERLGAQIVALVDSLTERERETLADRFIISTRLGSSDDGQTFEQRLYALLTLSLGQRTFLDSLRQSTAAYVRLKRETWARVTGRLPEAYGRGVPIGERAPALESDLWLGRPESNGPLPHAGRVSLVVFLTNPECMGRFIEGTVIDSDQDMYRNCAQRLIPLRRLAERFPALQLTIVAQTRGYFMYLKEGLTPAREAELTQQWLESFGVRAALAMTTTDVWRLPAPDGRRIARETANRTSYTFGKSWEVGNGSAFLIDEDGIIVHVAPIGARSEPEFAELIEILLARHLPRS